MFDWFDECQENRKEDETIFSNSAFNFKKISNNLNTVIYKINTNSRRGRQIIMTLRILLLKLPSRKGMTAIYLVVIMRTDHRFKMMKRKKVNEVGGLPEEIKNVILIKVIVLIMRRR